MRISEALPVEGTTLLVGLGNPMFGDDGCGVRLAERVEHALSARNPGPRCSPLSVAVAGTSPERCLCSSPHYDTVIFADAVECELAPGSVILMDCEQVAARYPQVSTHKLSLGLLARQLACRGVRTWLLGIQPACMSAGAGLSSAVAASVEGLAGALLEAVHGAQPTRPARTDR